MKKLNVYTGLLILLSSSFGACNKQLNVYPTTSEVDGNIIVDAKSAGTALNGVYYRFAAGGVDYNTVPSTIWYYTNEEIPSQLSGMLSYTNGGGGLDEHTYNVKTNGIDAIWNYGYALVNAANGFLKNIAPVTAITTTSKAQMIAEAKFLRAFGDAELLLYYGQFYDTTSAYGIILHNEFVDPSTIYLPRVSVAETYDSILSDLSNAIPDLPSVNTSTAYTNSWTAKLLKARVLINRGSAADYAQVISLTNDIITNSPFTLETNVKDIFWTKALTSTEVMLGVAPYPNQNIKWTDYIYYNDYGPNAFADSLFNGDPRAAWVIQPVTNPYGTNPGLTKYYPGSVTTIAAAAISENCYAFRLTEAYLLEAEALVASGGSMPDAKTLLKTVEGHGGVTDFTAVDAAVTASDLQLLIIKEEMRNFVAEAGQDWFAVRRLPFATLQALLPSVTTQSLLILPIPESEITTNPSIKQNPNY
ncbi:MAG TPA: RagB/SusD family nutrient uptake outer membrane protein [Puia sp.]|nr:RagB/SusD family nutrient uptake outer membrane protein [Puia sp.]